MACDCACRRRPGTLRVAKAADALLQDLSSRPERFAIGNVRWSSGLDYSQRFRIVVDWAEDLDVVQEIWQALCPRLGAGFGVDDIVRLYAERPELQQKNARYRGYHYTQTRRVAHAAGKGQGEGVEA